MISVLGINAYHADAACALIVDGEIVAAVEEERFTRVKHCAGFPSNSIRYCLETSGLSIEQVDHIAINTSPFANRRRKLLYSLINRPSPSFLWQKFLNKKERASLPSNLSNQFPNARINARYHYIEHHIAHIASAYFASPFLDSAIVSDGFGIS